VKHFTAKILAAENIWIGSNIRQDHSGYLRYGTHKSNEQLECNPWKNSPEPDPTWSVLLLSSHPLFTAAEGRMQNRRRPCNF
jgi:hypothetical protein